MISRLNNSNLLIAFEYLKKDEIMSFFISKFGNEIDVNERNNSNHAIALCNLIIEQQISFKAAITIKKKFHDLISKQIKEKYNINFDEYFAEDLPLLNTFIDDGLVENNANHIKVEQKARLLIRIICMSFDAYMKKHINQQRYSRVI